MKPRADSRLRLELYLEINEIISAMENLARVELHRATQLERTQENAFMTTLTAMAQFDRWHPQAGRESTGRRILILLGSERGFCGAFNERLARALEAENTEYDTLVVVGNRLVRKLADLNITASFAGPATTEEILQCGQRIIEYLLAEPLPAQLCLLCHAGRVVERFVILPEPDLPAGTPCRSLALHLPPKSLREELRWHCLQQGVLRFLLASVKAENHHRLEQMNGARDHLDEMIRTQELRLHALRQQEIVEEIEVILSAANGG